jgi:DnaK suppressor protein
MNKPELDQFIQQLVDLKADLQGWETEFKQAGNPVELDQTKVGRLSRMDAIQMQEMALESSRRRQQQLVKIESAFGRIDAHDYGYCLRCGEEIDVRRLHIDPTNTLCIKCAEM